MVVYITVLLVVVRLIAKFCSSLDNVYKTIILICRNLSRDSSALLCYARIHNFIFKSRLFNCTVISHFNDVVRKYPEKIAIYYKEEKWTFKQLDIFSNQVANYFTNMGYSRNDQLALIMNNRPEFIGIWLGLAKVGIITAFINTNIKNDSLIQTCNAFNCKAIIYESKFTQNVEHINEEMSKICSSLDYFIYGDNNSNDTETKLNAKPLHHLIKLSSKEFPINKYKLNFNDNLIYLFTSGTTGLPKASIIKHNRFIWGCTAIRIFLNFYNHDIVYISLPLYHSNASMLGTGQAIIYGNSIVLRDRFSASHFWDDCVKYKCTLAIYIGEICRYLLAQPVKHNDRNHKVRVMFGNGLRPQIWSEFVNRFGIKLIGEFYGSTEGNSNLINFTGHVGATGFYPYYYRLGTINLAKYLYPISIIKMNENYSDVLRDQNGLCIQAETGETGQMIGMIVDTNQFSHFDGYVFQQDNQKKIIRDVFKMGDKAFLSGDLLQFDENGFLYFKDRIGDTFRWKGENVSTNEVESIIQKLTHLSDCIVYGVSINHCEGKAGMAVIAYDKENDSNDFMQCLGEELAKQLPVYAIPLVIRLTNNIELTGTFKLSKLQFFGSGFNPYETNDQIYFFDKIKTAYIQMDYDLYENIQNGNIIV